MEFLTAHGPALLFYLFALIAVVGAICVVTMRNPMYGAIGLLVSFLAVAVLFLLRSAEFLAMVQVFVYGGGIMVLFLFVIMLVNQQQLKETHKFFEHRWVAVVVCLVLGAVLLFALLPTVFSNPEMTPPAFVDVDGEVRGNSEAVAWLLYRQYLMPFEIASVFLLVAMVGAVVLGRKE